MKSVRYVILLLAVKCLTVSAQKNELNLVFGGGVNYIFADQITQHRLGGSFYSGVNFIINKHNRGILFNPGFYITGNIYNTKLSKDFKARLNENTVGINLDVLLRIASKSYLRLGINYCRQNFAYPEIEIRNNSTQLYTYTGDDLYKDFSPYVYQAKILAGICIPIKLSSKSKASRTKLNLLLSQNAIPLVSKSYNLSTFVGNTKKTVWSPASYPTTLLMALDINVLARTDRKKSEEE